MRRPAMPQAHSRRAQRRGRQRVTVLVAAAPLPFVLGTRQTAVRHPPRRRYGGRARAPVWSRNTRLRARPVWLVPYSAVCVAESTEVGLHYHSRRGSLGRARNRILGLRFNSTQVPPPPLLHGPGLSTGQQLGAALRAAAATTRGGVKEQLTTRRCECAMHTCAEPPVNSTAPHMSSWMTRGQPTIACATASANPACSTPIL